MNTCFLSFAIIKNVVLHIFVESLGMYIKILIRYMN